MNLFVPILSLVVSSAVAKNNQGGFGLNNAPFSPGENDPGMMFAQDDETDVLFVGKEHEITLLKCDEDSECGCSTVGCLGAQKDFLVSTVKVPGGEKVVMTSRDWEVQLMACQKASQTAKISNAWCFGGKGTANATAIQSFRSVIAEIEVERDCEGSLVTIEFLCEDASGKPGSVRKKHTAKENDLRQRTDLPFTPQGLFLMAYDGVDGPPAFVAGEGFHFVLIQGEQDDEGWCRSSACLGDEVAFGMQGKQTSKGEKVVLSGNDFGEFSVLCPSQEQTISFNVLDENCTLSVSDEPEGPWVEFEGFSCGDSDIDFITVELECEN